MSLETHVSKEDENINKIILEPLENIITERKIQIYNKIISLGPNKHLTNISAAKLAGNCYEDILNIIKSERKKEMSNNTKEYIIDTSKCEITLQNGLTILIENNQIPKLLCPKVENVNIVVPNKVVEVTFADGTKEKSVCREPDTFSLESAISICISKKIMGGSSAYNNAVKRGMKVYEDKQKREAADKAEQERIEKKRAKRLAYKECRAAKRAEKENQRRMREREEQILIQTEAYLRAMKAMDDSKNVVVNEENN